MPKRKAALVLALGIFVGLYFAFDLGQFLNLQTLKAQQENIATFQSAKPALTVLIFFSIYVLSTAVSLPGAALLTLASGAIFGVFWGTLIASFASSLGATLALIMSRFLLRDRVMQRFGLEKMGISAGKIIDTNEFLQTRVPNIYTAGDAAVPFQFTHPATHQAWHAAANALFDPFKKFNTDTSVIPWATFVEPGEINKEPSVHVDAPIASDHTELSLWAKYPRFHRQISSVQETQ